MLNDLNHFHVHCARQLPFMGLLTAALLAGGLVCDYSQDGNLCGPAASLRSGKFAGAANLRVRNPSITRRGAFLRMAEGEAESPSKR
jgi:hypothetical protein